MSELRRWLLRLRNTFWTGRAERELDREMRAHLDLLEEEYQRRGLTPVEARRSARLALGGVETAKHQHRDARSLVWVDDLRRDTAYACRTLLRSPGFAVPAIVTMALAIGACTAIFTVVDHVLLRALPLPEADRLVRLYETNPAARRPKTDGSAANVADWRRATTTIEGLAAIGGTNVTLTGTGSAEALAAMLVGPEFFDIAGVRLALGAPFAPEEYGALANAALGPVGVETPSGGDAAVIISHAVWQRSFGSDPRVVGRRVQLNNRNAVVAGVMPADLRLNEVVWGAADCWIPIVESRLAAERRLRQFTVIGRLKPGVSAAVADTELKNIAARLEQQYPRDNKGWSVQVVPLKESLVGESRATLLVVLVGVGCVLLIASANIANLLLMRGVGRMREVAVRMAIGAGRSRLVRQWLTESLVLSLCGGVLGYIVALWAVPTLVAYAPPNLPRLADISVDERVFAVCMALSVVTGLVCGVAPALATRHVTIAAVRNPGAAGFNAKRRWLRPALVATQVALAIVLLVGAGLMTRTLMAVYAIDLGFNPTNVLSFGAQVRGERYRTMQDARDFNREVVQRLQRTAGILAAGNGTVPLVGALGQRFAVDGRQEPITAGLDLPSPGYFKALQIRLRAGRYFTDEDESNDQQIAIVNAAFARTAWGTTDVVGRRIRADQQPPTWMTVVGVVDDLRRLNLEAEAPPMVFLPFMQNSVASTSNYVVKTSGNADEAIGLVRDVIRSIDPGVPITRIATMDERVAKLVAPRQFNLWLLGLFSLVAGTLAGVGIYGLVNEAVTSRTPEIGVRMTLGARPAAIARMVVGRSLVTTLVGITVGLAASMLASRWLGSMLFGVPAIDPATLATVLAVFVAIVALAAFAPTRRATRVDPVIALRGD